MSIKTLRKRIALVAVATLGAGVLSVAPASAATFYAVGGDYDFTSTVSTSNYGVCFVGSTAASGSLTTANTLADNSTNTAEMTTNGQLVVTTAATALVDSGDSHVITVSGPATIKVLTPGTAGVTYGVDQKKLTVTASAASQTKSSFVVNPTGAGIVQVTIVENDGSDTSESRTLEVISITVRTSCLAGTPSASDSGAKFVDEGDAGTEMTAANVTSNDDSGKSTAANGEALYLRYDLFDTNGTAVPDAAATGTLTAETTGGALIGWETTGTTTIGYTNTKDGYWKITQGTEDAPWSGTVTIKLNGTTVFTKSGKITGKADSIVTSSLVNVEMAATATAGRYVVLDSAKNEIAVPITKLEDFSQANATIGAAGASSRTPVPGTADNRGTFTVNCSGSKGGTLTGLRLQYTFSNLTSIYSAPFNIVCGNATVATYTASLDKASYVPGDIATLTINAKDAFGNQVSDSAVMGTASTGEAVSIAGSNLTAVTAPTNSDTFTAGAKTYKFVVGSTEGSYNLVVDLDKWTTSTYNQSAVVVPYAIKASTTTVSNADVLKSIVSLIASINKQIQALQKLILRR